MRRTLQLACGVSLAAVLAACGGGSGAIPDPKPQPVALTSDQIRMYSGHSLLAGLVVQAPSAALSVAALVYILEQDQDADSFTAECPEGGSIEGGYQRSDSLGGVSKNDQVTATFHECSLRLGVLGLSLFDDNDDQVITLNGKATVLFTENTDIPIPKVAPGPTKPSLAESLKSFMWAGPPPGMEEFLSAATKVSYEQFQIGEVGDYTTFDGTVRVRGAIVDPTEYQKMEAPLGNDEEPYLTFSTSQNDGESLTVSFDEDDKSYAQTFTQFRSMMRIGCECDGLQHTISDLQYAAEGSDPELGENFAYSVQLEEPIVINEFEFGSASGKMLTTVDLGDDYTEEVTTEFASSDDNATVAISSTGGATWSGSFEEYLGFEFD